ncbi:hypothetical protein SAY87_011432 [Trapa incisa]|uniref:Uncharacterized protein n=1 Tax=Trapa incisa TaxID=236973 RepID=A0AAN7JJ38_9MYRT|nr:hypothetical protein SAY87_011432 [Trapa incisa]
MVEPQEPPGPQDPVDIVEGELEHGIGDPVAEHVHGVNDVQGVLEERQPLGDAHVQRYKTPRGDEVVEGSVQVHGRGDDGDIPLPHPGRKSPAAAAYVEPDADGTRGLGVQHPVYAVVEVAVVGEPPALLPPLKVEAIFAVVEARPLHAVHKAIVALAGVGLPYDARVRRHPPQALRQRRRTDVPLGAPRAAPPPGQRLAALEEQPLREDVVHRTLASHLVLHVLDEVVLVLEAGRPHGGVDGVGARPDREPEGEDVWTDGEPRLLRQALQQPPAAFVVLLPVLLRSDEEASHDLETLVKVGELGPGGVELGPGGGELGE